MKTRPREYKCSACGRETYVRYDKCLDCKEEGTVSYKMKPEQTTINSIEEAIEVAKALQSKSPDDEAAMIWVSRLINFIAALDIEDDKIMCKYYCLDCEDVFEVEQGKFAICQECGLEGNLKNLGVIEYDEGD